MSRLLSDPVSDRLLLKRYRFDRDMDAFQTLMNRHQGDLLRLAHALLGDATAAEDAVQDAFLRLIDEGAALLDRAGKEGRESLGGWLCATLRNHCFDQLRRRRLLRFFRFSPESHDGNAPSHNREEDPEHRVWHEVGTLPPLERAAILLRYREGMAYADIARQLGKSVTHIGLLLHQALGRLRDSRALRAEVEI